LTVKSLFFTGPREVAVKKEDFLRPGPDQVLVKALVSAISAGTELLIYRGEAPKNLAQDLSISALQGDLNYPLKFGYSMVGRIEECGRGVDKTLLGQRVFAFHPHQSIFLADPNDLILLPPELAPESAVFLPNLETAVNLVQDGAPMIGDAVAVFGQGVVGLLTAELLSRYPLSKLITVDPLVERRTRSENLGITGSLAPDDFDQANFDLCFELSGAPQALRQAISATRFSGRVVIGSWYGTKLVELDLGGAFHRSRIELLTSQVSTIAPHLRGRWDKLRRMRLVMDLLPTIELDEFITHKYPLSRAEEAYSLLDQHPSEALQVLLTYPDS
jgi:2-desacetyl-2-hydroxyethyl bacteriochlorophyllide A dehydrogenase